MQKLLNIGLLLWGISSFMPVVGQHISYSTAPIVCHTSNKVESSKIEIEADLIRELQEGRLDGENIFELTLIDVPSAANTTIDFATDIWSSIITTEIPIKVYINWVSLEDRVLGSARPGSYEANFIGAPLRSVAYPIALAERLAQQELNEEDDFEIFISLNKEFTWYYGIDGNPLPDTHDLLSVVLHEIGHGLGLADTFSASSGNGSYGTNGRANIYDYFVVNDDNLRLVNLENFPNFSNEMYNQLTSNNIFTGSRLATNQNGDNHPQLYAPSEFNGGSSISHLDETAFPPGDPNSLMSPQIGREEVVHTVGPISQAMLAEMGYVYAFISHDTLQDQPDPAIDAIITGSIKSDSALYTDKAFVNYSFDDFETVLKSPLTFDENYNFTATIPAPMDKKLVSYFIEVEDVNNIAYRLPAASQLENFEFGYGLITSLNTELVVNSPEMSVYPNPSNGVVSITLSDNSAETNITILNLNGKVVDQWKTTTTKASYKRTLAQGYYLVKIQNSMTQLTQKLLVR